MALERAEEYGHRWRSGELLLTFKGVIVRRHYSELEHMMYLIQQMYRDVGVLRGKRDFIFTDPSYCGAEIHFRHARNVDDAEKIRGHEYDMVSIDEANLYPTAEVPNTLISSSRSSIDINAETRAVITFNPQKAGFNNWIKPSYIDPAPPWTTFENQHGIKCIYVNNNG